MNDNDRRRRAGVFHTATCGGCWGGVRVGLGIVGYVLKP
jgi:hypothetical protein